MVGLVIINGTGLMKDDMIAAFQQKIGGFASGKTATNDVYG